MVYRIRSFPPTQGLVLPEITNLKVCGTFIHISPVAMATAISVDPIPVAKADSAPYVQV